MMKPAVRLALAAITVAGASVMPALSWSQSAAQYAHRVEPAREGTQFSCEDGSKLYAVFTTRGADLLAVVDHNESGSHELVLKPWDGGEPRITWSDGPHTLVWSVGVQIMYMEDGAHLMCGRGDHSHH